ncbi:MAG: phosphatidylserine decarboxylase family protein [Bacteroides sp.]|nr:phosphatidylserine decarboxylase family protein [Bacteroides sp.]MDD2645949.1 phosphatidylserine decarboxylase family protein [Bacteroides sp.]MDD4055206.1 phosphatidylserine decarboxylase family protein [Bacteroides sp.]MDD4720663.1 phosphatidylserine decarboxylase family protein [Bacteroides sp.]NLI63857.1 phosphatidylserine decarboxylase family protein [Bacteroidales bacterium]
MGRLKKIKNTKIHREGVSILIGSLLLFIGITLLLYLGFETKIPFYIALVVLTPVYLVMLNFFRCPERYYEGETEKLVIAPADGTIVVVEEVDENEYFKDRRLMISIFMSVFNVHANWYPVNGVVKKVQHHRGRFHQAWLPKSSTENERSTIVIETPDGEEVLVRQIAGALARRIVTYAEEDTTCHINEHMGFIKFGSRVDVYLPLGTEVMTKIDDKTTGNQTVIAKLK